jgi:nucleoside-diphosphate-sugar epimerase
VAKAFSPPLRVDIRGKAHPDQAAERYVPSIARAQSELGLHARISLEASIAATIRFQRGSTEHGR